MESRMKSLLELVFWVWLCICGNTEQSWSCSNKVNHAYFKNKIKNNQQRNSRNSVTKRAVITMRTSWSETIARRSCQIYWKLLSKWILCFLLGPMETKGERSVILSERIFFFFLLITNISLIKNRNTKQISWPGLLHRGW